MGAETKQKKKIGLTTKIFIALLAGAVFGIVLCYMVPSGHVKDDIIVEGILYVVGQGFIRLMKMLVVPFTGVWKYGNRRYEEAWYSWCAYTDLLPLYDGACYYSSAQCRKYYQSGNRS